MSDVIPRGTTVTLASLLDMATTYLEQRLGGLTDEEWLWEPVPECWSLRDGVVDWAIEDPSPAPFTTIAWRLNHLQGVNEAELCWMRDEEFDWGSKKVPRSANEGVELWRESAGGLREFLGALSDIELESPTKRGLPRIYWASTLARENIHHGAEIGVLRDLYRHHH